MSISSMIVNVLVVSLLISVGSASSNDDSTSSAALDSSLSKIRTKRQNHLSTNGMNRPSSSSIRFIEGVLHGVFEDPQEGPEDQPHYLEHLPTDFLLKVIDTTSSNMMATVQALYTNNHQAENDSADATNAGIRQDIGGDLGTIAYHLKKGECCDGDGLKFTTRDVDRLGDIAVKIKDRISFTFGKNSVASINGVSIQDAIEGAMQDFHHQKWFTMGYQIGKAVTLCADAFDNQQQQQVQDVTKETAEPTSESLKQDKQQTIDNHPRDWHYIAEDELNVEEPDLTIALLVVEGILVGAVDVELPSVETCVQDVLDDITFGILRNVKNLRLAKAEAAAAKNIHAIGFSFVSLADVVKDCGLGVKEVEKLQKIGANFANPMTFAYHFGKDIIVNGVSIFNAVEDAVADYDDEKWYNMGYDVGKVVALAVLGSDLAMLVATQNN